MLIKHLKHGTGNAKKASNYLLQEKDSTGKIRDAVEILRGDPEQVAAVANSLNFKHRYTSGVIAWAPGDNPTPEQIQTVLDDYEKIAFAGLEPYRYAFSAVLHRENKSVHIHTLTARVDLNTGKSLNIAPPGHLKAFNAMCDMHNYQYGWARPGDPARARLQQPGYHAYIDAAKVRQGLKVEPDTRAFIGAYLVQKAYNGEINNRQDVLTALHDAGLETPRAGEDYITAKDPESGEKYRLKGVLYNAKLKYEDIKRQIERENGDGPETNGKIDERAAAKAHREYDRICAKRAEFNYKKYGATTEINKKRDHNNQQNNGFVRSPGEYQIIEKEPDNSMDETADNRLVSLSRYLCRQLGSNAISVKSDNDKNRDNTNITDSEQRASSFASSSDKKSDNTQEKTGSVASGRWEMGNTTEIKKKDVKNGINRVRTSTHQEFSKITDRAAEISNRAAEITDRAEQNNRNFIAACRRFDNCLQQPISDIQQRNKGQGEAMIRNNSNVELERFKTEIDLARWLESQGWQKDFHTSCRSSAVLRKDNDKIVVSKQRGNFVYKNVKSSGDQGSIIDFIQHRKKLNLGQIRKILRPVLQGDFKPLHDWKAPKYAVDQAQDKWLRGDAVFDYKYLNSRGIKKETVQKYDYAIRQDPQRNLMFLHYSTGMGGYTGYEKKAVDGTGSFAAGGAKSFFPLKLKNNFTKIVITESAIDALSYAQIDDCREDTAYISLAGNPSEMQLKELYKLCSKKQIETVILAHDNDEKGDEQAQICNDVLQDLQDSGDLKIVRKAPQYGKDWNEQLEIQIKAEEEKESSQEYNYHM